MLRSAAIALAVVLACSCTREKLGGIEVTLRFMPTSTAQCARVYVTGEDHRTQKPTDAMPRLMRDLNVGIQQSADLGNTVTIEAHGYDTPDCTGAWTDDSSIEEKTFVAGTVLRDVLLILDGRPVTNSDGGVEICDNGVDDDADTQADCKDFDCDGKSCGAPKLCVNFTCQRPTREVNCTDGMDDDGNGKIDCADDACATKSCVSTDACLLNKRCVGLMCGGDPVTCNMPTPCQMPGSGMCVLDGGCGYANRTGPCGDGGTCSAGACTLSFPFVPHNVPQEIPESEMNGDLTIACATSLDSDTGQWANLCIGQTPPRSFLVNQPGGAPVLRVIPLRSLQVTGTITLTGTKPVAFAVLGNATVSGTIAANADGGLDGSGSPGASCGTGLGNPAVVGTTAGGGGAGHGGQGERGGDGFQMSASGGNRGAQSNDNDLSPLRGGCSGGLGATPVAGTIAASGGGGGGAFQLTVAGTLSVTGHLLANGAGGRGGPSGKGGGGGGGSGGGILLEATTTTLSGTARVLTNGGGGGAGATGNMAGDPGEDGHADDADAASGGSAPGEQGGDAEDLGNGAQRGDDGSNGSSAAGGGGSGMGRVVVFNACTQTSGVVTSPDLPNGMCTNI